MSYYNSLICDYGKVSVIMTHYNCERYIFSAVNSILNQTYQNLELIVVDDASDNSIWIDKLSKFSNDKRLKLFQSDTRIGPYRIKNHLIQNYINAPFIAFQDSDDISFPHRIITQLNFMLKKKCDIVGSGFIAFDENDSILYKRKMLSNVNFWIKMNKSFVCHHPTILLRREVFSILSGFDGTTMFGADTDFIFRAAHMFEIRNYQDSLYKYRIHADSLTQRDATGFKSQARKEYYNKILNEEKNRQKEKNRSLLFSQLIPPENNIDFHLKPINI